MPDKYTKRQKDIYANRKHETTDPLDNLEFDVCLLFGMVLKSQVMMIWTVWDLGWTVWGFRTIKDCPGRSDIYMSFTWALMLEIYFVAL